MLRAEAKIAEGIESLNSLKGLLAGIAALALAVPLAKSSILIYRRAAADDWQDALIGGINCSKTSKETSANILRAARSTDSERGNLNGRVISTWASFIGWCKS